MNDNSRRIDLTYPTTTTTGNLTVGSVTYPNNLPGLQTWPTQSYWSYPPTVCSENYHVFSCNHALACKCGKVARPEPIPQTCPGCGTSS
jgi:hypothetical protein